MKEYHPFDWYWTVGGDQSRAFSSKTGGYVQADDAAFVAWKSDGTIPTNIDTETNLGAVLAPLRIRPVHSGVLDGYLEKQAGDLVDLIQSKWLANHENRLRACERALNLNGNPPNLSAAQMRAAIKVLL